MTSPIRIDSTDMLSVRNAACEVANGVGDEVGVEVADGDRMAYAVRESNGQVGLLNYTANTHKRGVRYASGTMV